MIVYDKYGDPNEDPRALYFAIVFDALNKMSSRASAAGLRELARVKDKTISAPARDILQSYVDRGLLKSTGLGKPGLPPAADLVRSGTAAVRLCAPPRPSR